MDDDQLINTILEFDPSDAYHGDDTLDAMSYYAAIDRVVALLRGEIGDWTDARKP